MFSNTKIIANKRSSSIVIKFDERKGISELNLPLCLADIPDSYEIKKELFFQTYHTYRKFIEEKKSLAQNQKSRVPEKSIVEQDVVYEDNEKYQFKDGITGEVITYQKLVMFDSIIDAYDKFKIQALQEKISKSDRIDYSKLHRYIHHGIFLSPDDNFYIDEMDQPKKIIRDATTEIVEMFCFIYSEILNEFGGQNKDLKVSVLANNFKENRLYEDSALFSEDMYSDTIEILKETLEEIDRLTPYKDFDYWHFYDAIYNFIYSNNNGSWTLDNFSFIWERMCLAFARKYYSTQIALYDDFGTLINGLPEFPLMKYFKVSLNPNEEKNPFRYIRPDLIMKDTLILIDDNFLENIYQVVTRENEIDISYKKDVDIKSFFDVDRLKKYEFQNKPRVKSFLEKKKFYPPTISVSFTEYRDFKEKAKALLLKKGFFELSPRHPNIIKNPILQDSSKSFLVVDYKFMGEDAFHEPLDDKIQITVKKQLVYELALKININSFTRSEFWIPGYSEGRYEHVPKVIRRYSKNCNPFFQRYRISVIQLDFLSLQKIYIKDVF